MRFGIDYRPALHNREGIGRYVRELVRAAIEIGLGSKLALFASTLAPTRYTRQELGLADSRVRFSRLRLPSRWMPRFMELTRRGADDWLGGVGVFHHTQTHVLPVRRAVETAMLFDCIWADTEHGWVEPEHARAMRASAAELARRAAKLLVPSRFVMDEVSRVLAVPKERIEVTELGCDHVLRSLPSTLEPPREPYFLTVSRVDPRKNHLRTLRAFERLAREGCPQRWIVAGPRGWNCEPFERALESSPARDRIDRREFVPDDEVAALYANADAFVFASFAEGFGLPPLEAMACGAPVIAGDATSLTEICSGAALLVDPASEDAIFEALRRLARDRELARDLAERGRARAAQFTWRECARKTLAALERAAQTAGEDAQLD